MPFSIKKKLWEALDSKFKSLVQLALEIGCSMLAIRRTAVVWRDLGFLETEVIIEKGQKFLRYKKASEFEKLEYNELEKTIPSHDIHLDKTKTKKRFRKLHMLFF